MISKVQYRHICVKVPTNQSHLSLIQQCQSPDENFKCSFNQKNDPLALSPSFAPDSQEGFLLPLYHLSDSSTVLLVSCVMCVFSARCNICISRLCYDVSVHLSVHLSVTEVHWRIIANLGFKFQSHFTVQCGRRAACGRIILRHASKC